MVATGRRNPREARGARSPYWSTGPGAGVNVEGMKEQSDLDAWRPALSQSMRELADAGGSRTVLKILELCAGCKSVSTAAAKEARETFGIERVEVFSLDGKPGTNCSRCADILTYDWTLRSFREEREEGVSTPRTQAPPADHTAQWPVGIGARCRSGTYDGGTRWRSAVWSLSAISTPTSGPLKAEAHLGWTPGCSCEHWSRSAAP